MRHCIDASPLPEPNSRTDLFLTSITLSLISLWHNFEALKRTWDHREWSFNNLILKPSYSVKTYSIESDDDSNIWNETYKSYKKNNSTLKEMNIPSELLVYLNDMRETIEA